MDYAELYRKEWAEFQAQARGNRGLKTQAPESAWERWARNVVRFFRRTPELPEDPFAYATAPKKPRLPRRGASAAAKRPD